MAARTPGERAANKFLNALDSIDFNPTAILFSLDTASTRMKARVLNVFISIIDDWAMRYDMALWNNDEEMDMYMQAKRWQETMRVFSPVEYED